MTIGARQFEAPSRVVFVVRERPGHDTAGTKRNEASLRRMLWTKIYGKGELFHGRYPLFIVIVYTGIPILNVSHMTWQSAGTAA